MKNLTLQDFLTGDIVQLKSGSPNMTISKKDDDYIHCEYWNEHTATFNSIALDYHMLNNFTAEERS